MSGGVHTADYNNFLFPDDQLEAILCALDYVEICIIMSGLAKIFINYDAGAVIILHRPWGIGIDSRDHVSIEDSILRLLLAEIIRRVVLRTTRVPPIGLPQTIENGAITAAYFFEMARRGYHVPKKIAAPCARDCITDHETLACVQNNLSRHSSDPDFPTGHVGRAAWREKNGGQRVRMGVRPKLTDRENNAIIILRLRAALSFLKSKLHAESESSVLESIEEFIKEDDRADSTYRYRWNSLLKSFPVGSEMHRVIDNHIKGTRNNSGNAGATGKTNEEQAVYDGDFPRLLALHKSEQVFMMRNDTQAPEIPPQSVQERAKKEGWVVLTNFSYVVSSVKNRLKTRPHRLENGKFLTIQKWNRKFPTNKSGSKNIIKVDGWAACIMWER